MHSTVESLEQALGYHFKNPSRAQPFIEKTYGTAIMRRKLAFVGDGVAKFLVSEYLLGNPNYSSLEERGALRDWLTSNEQFALYARKLGLCNGEGTNRNSIHERATWFEALVAAVYQDGGVEAAKNLVLDHISQETWDTLPAKYIGFHGLSGKPQAGKRIA